jgi:uncharacterized 2Fe-2S/4Fe-4S cluster protein (DUF4445 family)
VKRYHEIIFEPSGRRVQVLSGTTILRAAKEAGVRIRSECDGNGICGKCMISIFNMKDVKDLTESEKKHLSSSDIDLGYRLACQVTCTEDIIVNVPHGTRIWKSQLQTTGAEKDAPLNPSIKKFHICLPKPSLSDSASDVERLLSYLKDEHCLGELDVKYELLQTLPDILRKADWDVTVIIWNDKEIIGVQDGDTTDKIFGLALDIGTSKLAIQLVDLTTGRTVRTGVIENPQLIYGEDIMTRITFAMNSYEKLKELQRSVVEGVNNVLQDTLAEARISPQNIFEAVVVGNTAMHHFFLGIQPKFLSLSPFVPCVSRSIQVKAKELNVKIHPNSIIHVMPIVAGFVGADVIGDLLSTGIHEENEISLLIDIGTNTEVLIGDSEDTLCCSCASGPAFEGGHIKHGVKAVPGAIKTVRIDPNSYEVTFETIDDQRPLGLCGSAVVDAVAEMRLCKIINHQGRFNLEIETSRIRTTNNKIEFLIADKNETATDEHVTVTQNDINEVQLAKAAIFTACSILMKEKRLTEEEIDQMLIAGAFGSSLNIRNAQLLGLIPNVPLEKVRLVGNTAVTGAKMALVSKRARETAETLSRNVRYLELTVDPGFNKEFAKAMFIPHKDLERFSS